MYIWFFENKGTLQKCHAKSDDRDGRKRRMLGFPEAGVRPLEAPSAKAFRSFFDAVFFPRDEGFVPMRSPRRRDVWMPSLLSRSTFVQRVIFPDQAMSKPTTPQGGHPQQRAARMGLSSTGTRRLWQGLWHPTSTVGDCQAVQLSPYRTPPTSEEYGV